MKILGSLGVFFSKVVLEDYELTAEDMTLSTAAEMVMKLSGHEWIQDWAARYISKKKRKKDCFCFFHESCF